MYNSYLIDFIQGLSPTEVRLVEEHLNKSKALFDKKNEAMELILFKLITSQKEKTITDEIIIKETGTKRVTDLKNNLFDKVLESLTQNKHITNQQLFNESDINSFTLKKKLLFFKISIRTQNQGKIKALFALLDEIISKAIEFETYDVLTEALNAKKFYHTIRQGNISEFENIKKQISDYSYCYEALNRANENYYRLILNSKFIQTLSSNEAEKHMLASIKEMENDYKKTKSEQINYYLHIMRFALLERKKEYSNSIKECNKLIHILENNKAIYRNERMGFVHDNLCLFKIHLGDYASGAKEAKHAQSYYLENSLNYAISKEQEFLAFFYGQDLSKANRCLVELLNHTTLDTGEFRKSKFIYYQACTLFSEQKYLGILRILNESKEIEKDKTRWNIALRILQIMIFIETDKIDQASSSLEALRKHVSRTEKTDEISERASLIVKLLREIEKDGFEYRATNSAAEKIMKQLQEKEGPTAWEHYSAELIKFHEWLEKRKRK